MAGTTLQLSRDLKALARRLAGHHPPPLLKGWPRGVAPATATATTTTTAPTTETRPVAVAGDPRAARELTVTRLVRETEHAYTLVLEAPSRAPFAFEPGQFFTVLAEVDGRSVPRNYSASNAPGTRELHLTFKVKAGGVVSPWLASRRAGDVLRVLGPFGAFVPPAHVPAGGRRLVLVAGGAGVTPLLAIARTVLAREPSAEIAFVVGNRRPADVVLAGALTRLGAEHERLTLVHVHEETAEGAPGRGRLDRAVVSEVLAALPLSAHPDAQFFVCGPDAMRDEVLAALAARGVAAPAIFVERFTIGPRPNARNSSGYTGDLPLLTIVGKGQRHRTIALPGASLLEAGLAAGVAMPFSCGVGGCGACRVKRISGDITLEEPNCLTAAERAAGYVLACVGRPSGPCEIAIEEE